MKNFSDINEKELEYINEHGIFVKEMLDMIYFRVVLTGGKFYIENSKGRKLGIVDRIVNSDNNDIFDFCSVFNPNVNPKFYEKFGECKIGFFYLPVHKTKVIDYKNVNPGTFFLSDLYTKDKSKKDELAVLDSIKDFDNELYSKCSGTTLIRFIPELPEGINEYNNVEDIVGVLTDYRSVTNNEISEIEGIILESGKYKFMIKMNNSSTSIEKSTKLIYRDVILEDFISVLEKEYIDSVIMDENKNYIDKIQELFLEYIDKTDVLSRIMADPEDMLPPYAGHIGDISYDYLNSTVNIICRSNEIYKNILRILMVAFRGECKDKFFRFPDNKRKEFERISKCLNF